MSRKETVEIVVAGHVDHGKSTLIGRLLLDTGSLSKERLDEIRNISSRLGSENELAYLTDQLEEEREGERTIDTTQTFFKTRRRNYCIIDAPGHAEFIKKMMTGASLAKAALLVVDARLGVMDQTRRHLYILRMLGIAKIAAVLNKMDAVGYAEQRFVKVRGELLGFMKKMEMEPCCVVPISAKEGVNISKPPAGMPWYKGPYLLKALDSIAVGAKSKKRPLRFPVQDVYDDGARKIIVGMVAAGAIRCGQKVVLLPSFKEAIVKTIKVFGRNKKRAAEGESIGLVIEESSDIKRGSVIVQKGGIPAPLHKIKGSVLWMSEDPLRIGDKITIRCATQEADCFPERITNRIDSSTLEVIEEDSKELKTNEAAIVTFRTKSPIVVERFDFVEELGRFVLESAFVPRGAGVVIY